MCRARTCPGAAGRRPPATDPDAKIVRSIAAHPGLSEARLRAMVDRHGARVVARVAANPDATPPLPESARVCMIMHSGA